MLYKIYNMTASPVEFWPNVMCSYPNVARLTLPVVIPFALTYLGEPGCSTHIPNKMMKQAECGG